MLSTENTLDDILSPRIDSCDMFIGDMVSAKIVSTERTLKGSTM